MHAYVYVRTEPGQARDVGRSIADRGDPRVQQVSLITGEWDLLVHIDTGAGGMQDLGPRGLAESVLDGIGRSSGVHQTATAPVIAGFFPIPTYPTIHLAAVVALVHIKVVAGRGKDVYDALTSLAEREVVAGVAPLAGPYDILCEIGGDTWEEISRVLLEHVQGIDGIAETNTSIATEKFIDTAEATAG